MSNSNFDPNQLTRKQIGKIVKEDMRNQQQDREKGGMGAATLAVLCLVGAYLMPFIGSYFVLAAAVFAGISWLMSR